MASITIVMYHYVRERLSSRYPELKFLEFKNFISQLNYLQKNYTLIKVEDMVDYLQGNTTIPERACLLTFDDGYLDHYLYVFPELYKRGIQGAFYPPCAATKRNKVMEVNKIQLILASIGYNNITRLIKELKNSYITLHDKEEFNSLADFDTLYYQYAKPSRFDSADVMFVKAMLQYALPHSLRSSIIQHLYDQFVAIDEKILSSELYMSIDMLKVMQKSGMHIGSHGDSHIWLNKISKEQQKKEIYASLAMLEEIHGNKSFLWTMCYPFGGNDTSLRALCEENRCAFALTTVAEVANLTQETRFSLSRIDTNDLPPMRKGK